jgi:hypothetical protein
MERPIGDRRDRSRTHARFVSALAVSLMVLLQGCAGFTYTPTIASVDESPTDSFPAIGVSIAPPANPPLSSVDRYRIMQELEIARDRNAAISARQRTAR